jgi:hypothetical protein
MLQISHTGNSEKSITSALEATLQHRKALTAFSDIVNGLHLSQLPFAVAKSMIGRCKQVVGPHIPDQPSIACQRIVKLYFQHYCRML